MDLVSIVALLLLGLFVGYIAGMGDQQRRYKIAEEKARQKEARIKGVEDEL